MMYFFMNLTPGACRDNPPLVVAEKADTTAVCSRSGVCRIDTAGLVSSTQEGGRRFPVQPRTLTPLPHLFPVRLDVVVVSQCLSLCQHCDGCFGAPRARRSRSHSSSLHDRATPGVERVPVAPHRWHDLICFLSPLQSSPAVQTGQTEPRDSWNARGGHALPVLSFMLP